MKNFNSGISEFLIKKKVTDDLSIEMKKMALQWAGNRHYK